LWSGVKDYFSNADQRLWQEPTEDNPNNLLRIVTLQEMQAFMLDTWADSRTFTFSSTKKTQKAASDFWKGFPTTFFTDEWKKKGLQTSVGRRILRSALADTRRH